jgi:Pyridoxal-phosphate dependent enzyme
VFIQGGVGGVAAAVSVQMRALPLRLLVVVEPDRAACLLASAELGEATAIPRTLNTLMAGLACGEPSLIAWQELDRAATAFMAIPDAGAVACMRLLADLGIVARGPRAGSPASLPAGFRIAGPRTYRRRRTSHASRPVGSPRAPRRHMYRDAPHLGARAGDRSTRDWLTPACTKITQRQWKRCAPQATERPWIPSVSQTTVTPAVASR